jgi:pimeloyl-ACP methyl ester carboxylesterase
MNMECQIGNRSVYYKIVGEGKTLLTISGIPSDHHIVESWLEPIFEKHPGWQRIYFDLPGTGETSGEGITTIDQVLDIVCEFIDAILPGQRFTLLGLSAGGYLARGVVMRKAEFMDGLCLLVPWLGEHEDDELPAHKIIYKDSDAMSQLSADDAEKLAGLAVVQDQKVVDWYRNVVIKARQGKNRSEIEDRVYSFDLEAALHPFEKPTLILTGRQDTHVGYKDAWNVLEKYPRATFAVLDRSGHALGVEQETLFQAFIHEWLDRVAEPQSNI